MIKKRWLDLRNLQKKILEEDMTAFGGDQSSLMLNPLHVQIVDIHAKSAVGGEVVIEQKLGLRYVCVYMYVCVCVCV
jgi:hypothetical protein